MLVIYKPIIHNVNNINKSLVKLIYLSITYVNKTENIPILLTNMTYYIKYNL